MEVGGGGRAGLPKGEGEEAAAAGGGASSLFTGSILGVDTARKLKARWGTLDMGVVFGVLFGSVFESGSGVLS